MAAVVAAGGRALAAFVVDDDDDDEVRVSVGWLSIVGGWMEKLRVREDGLLDFCAMRKISGSANAFYFEHVACRSRTEFDVPSLSAPQILLCKYMHRRIQKVSTS